MGVRTIGLLFGAEDAFPRALVREVNDLASRRSLPLRCEPVLTGHVSQEQAFPWDVILDRVGHDVPFYATLLRCAAARGATVLNDPFRPAAADRLLGEVVARALGVAVPRTVLLPHKEHPPGTSERTFRNMTLVDWDEVFRYVGFPAWLKPVRGGARGAARKVHGRDELFEAYDLTRDVATIAQEAIEPAERWRCWVVGRRKARVVPCAPSEPRTRAPDDLALRLTRDALALSDALGYDLHAVEFAVRDGVPYAIDLRDGAPEADPDAVSEESFRWLVSETAELLVDRALHPRPWAPAGSWPKALGLVPR